MSDLATLAKRLDKSPDPDRAFAVLACCLEETGGNLPAACDLAELTELQMDEDFERFHPRHDDGKFRDKTKAETNRHAREREEYGQPRPAPPPKADEPQPGFPEPVSENRQKLRAAMEDPELQQHLVTRAHYKLGSDLRSQADPEDIVQQAFVRALREADKVDLDDVAGWLAVQVERTAIDFSKGARAFKRRGGKPHLSLDAELDAAERVGQANGTDPYHIIGQAIGGLPDAERKLLTAYYGLRRRPQNIRFTDAQRKAAERARKKLKPLIEAQYDAADAPPRDTSPLPAGKLPGSGEGKGKQPEESAEMLDPTRQRIASTAAAHEGKVWHKKPAESALHHLASTDLSPDQIVSRIEAIRNAHTKQFDEETHSVDPDQDNLTDIGARSAAAAVNEARRTIIELVKKKGLVLDSDLSRQIEEILRGVQPTLEKILAETSVAATVRGADDVLRLSPKPLTASTYEPPGEPPRVEQYLFPAGEPLVRFPVLEAAARRIAQAELLKPEDFYKLSSDAKQHAFTVSGDLTAQSVGKIRQAIYENLIRGPSLDDFTKEVDELFQEGLPISRGHLEQVFRNTVNGAWSDAHDKALTHPVVASAFPYRAYNATHDQRVRDEHLLMEQSGLSGSNIYHTSDPVWQALRPPWAWSCRCSFTPTTIQQAARAGVEHAQKWQAAAQEAGVEPEQLDYPAEHVPWPTLNGQRIEPPAGWTRAEQFADAQEMHRVLVGEATNRRPRRPKEPQQVDPGWQRPDVQGTNAPPRSDQLPGGTPLPKVPGTRLVKAPPVAPTPRVDATARILSDLHARYPRLARLKPFDLRVQPRVSESEGAYGAYKREDMTDARRGWFDTIKRPFPSLKLPILENPSLEGVGAHEVSYLGNPQSRDSTWDAHTVRHEYGHHVWHESPRAQAEWEALHEEHLPAVKEIAPYGGALGPDESFPELFAIFTHPGYGSEEVPKLPPEIEAYFRRLLGVS